MAFKVDVQVTGLPELRRKLDGNRLLAQPLRTAFDEVGRAGASAMRSGAPVLTGKLRGKISHRLTGGAIPSGVTVSATARRGSFPYPRLLEFSPKHGHKGWGRKAVEGAAPQFQRALEKAARQLEAQFNG